MVHSRTDSQSRIGRVVFRRSSRRPARALAIALVAGGLTTIAWADGNQTFGLGGVATDSAITVALHNELLSFEDRVRYQRRIEEVYWRHRIWPAENSAPKPALDEVLSDAVIRERVATYLQKSAALEAFWQRPLTGEQLQAELNRMVRQTKKPELLRELFTALENDPVLAAECLARCLGGSPPR